MVLRIHIRTNQHSLQRKSRLSNSDESRSNQHSQQRKRWSSNSDKSVMEIETTVLKDRQTKIRKLTFLIPDVFPPIINLILMAKLLYPKVWATWEYLEGYTDKRNDLLNSVITYCHMLYFCCGFTCIKPRQRRGWQNLWIDSISSMLQRMMWFCSSKRWQKCSTTTVCKNCHHYKKASIDMIINWGTIERIYTINTYL